MIAVIDYQMGNLRSVQKALEKVGFQAEITNSCLKVGDAQAVILPGVGAFRDCMSNLEKLGLVKVILKSIQSGKPFLGICLGTQVLFSESEEFGIHQGLGVIKGKVKRLPDSLKVNEEGTSERKSISLKIPHMGWNTIEVKRASPLFKGILDNPYFYFVHSYYVEPEDQAWVLATTTYGIEFASVVGREHIFACQFHPEKSQKAGLTLLKNFCNFVYSL